MGSFNFDRTSVVESPSSRVFYIMNNELIQSVLCTMFTSIIIHLEVSFLIHQKVLNYKYDAKFLNNMT